MADAGLTVYNNENFLQIDSNFKNYSLVRSRIITDRFQLNFESNEYGGGGNTPIVTVMGSNPIIAIHCNYGTRTFRVKNPNGSFSFYIMLSEPSGITIPFRLVYYVFDTVTTYTGGFGLQVFDELGVPVFDSSRLYLKPVGQIQDVATPWASFGPSAWISWTRTYPIQVTKPGLVTCLQAVKMELQISGSPPEIITETGIFVVTGRYWQGSVQFRCHGETQISQSGGGGPWAAGTPYWRSLVVEVEGLPENYG